MAHVPGQQFSLALRETDRTESMHTVVVSTFQTMVTSYYGHTILHTILPGDEPKETGLYVTICLHHSFMKSKGAQEPRSKRTHTCFSWSSKEVVGLL